MKKITFQFSVFLIFILNINISNAQTYFGFKVGTNFSNINGDNDLKGVKFGMHVGAVTEIQISDLFSLQPELLYSKLGSQDKNNKSLKYNNNYIVIPIMVKYFINNVISIDLGPQVGYLLFAKSSNGWEEWTDIKKDLNTFDYGINLGASYEMDNGMNINIRYNYNFANIYKADILNLDANNTVIQLSLGYKFY